MQRHAFFDPVFHHRREDLRALGEENEKRVQVEGPRAKARLVARQCHFADLDLAARAPREDGRCPGRGEAVDRRIGYPRRIFEIPFAKLVHAAALPGPAHDLVVDTEEIEHVETEERNVRGLQDVAPRVEDDIGWALTLRLAGLPPDPGQCLGRQLQPRQDPHAAAHRLKTLPPVRVEPPIAALRPRKAAGELNHEARIDPLRASRNTTAAAAAYRSPARRFRGAGAAGDQIDDAACGVRRVDLAEPCGCDHRAGAKTRTAARAHLGDRFAARPEVLDISGRAVHAAHSGITNKVSIFWLSRTTSRSTKR